MKLFENFRYAAAVHVIKEFAVMMIRRCRRDKRQMGLGECSRNLAQALELQVKARVQGYNQGQSTAFL